MAIVKAYQCPYTNRLFDLNNKPKYVKHLKKMARTTFPLRKAERYAKTFDLKKFRNSVQSLDHLNELLINNFHKYLSLVVVNLDFDVFTRYAKEFNIAFRQESIVDKCVLTDNSPRESFWISRTQNYSFLGLPGQLIVELTKEHKHVINLGSDLIKLLGFHTHSGSISTHGGIPYMGYDFHLNAMDWKFVAQMCIADYLKKNIPHHNNFDTDKSWHNYYRILIDTHWPGLFTELQPVLSLYASLGAGEQEVSNLINLKFNMAPIESFERVILPHIEL